MDHGSTTAMWVDHAHAQQQQQRNNHQYSTNAPTMHGVSTFSAVEMVMAAAVAASDTPTPMATATLHTLVPRMVAAPVQQPLLHPPTLVIGPPVVPPLLRRNRNRPAKMKRANRCTKCGATDHYNSTRKKCPMHKDYVGADRGVLRGELPQKLDTDPSSIHDTEGESPTTTEPQTPRKRPPSLLGAGGQCAKCGGTDHLYSTRLKCPRHADYTETPDADAAAVALMASVAAAAATVSTSAATHCNKRSKRCAKCGGTDHFNSTRLKCPLHKDYVGTTCTDAATMTAMVLLQETATLEPQHPASTVYQL